MQPKLHSSQTFGPRGGARTFACRVETPLDTTLEKPGYGCRHECRHGTQERVRHLNSRSLINAA
jgi:hypothetical protein